MNTYFYLVVGLIPYFIRKQQVKSKPALEIRALFWSFQSIGSNWTVCSPIIKQLQKVVWVTVTGLRDDNNDMSEGTIYAETTQSHRVTAHTDQVMIPTSPTLTQPKKPLRNNRTKKYTKR